MRCGDKTKEIPRISFKLSILVVPMMGAVTPSFDSIHAIAICAILTPFFFAKSSTLSRRAIQHFEPHVDRARVVPCQDLRSSWACIVLDRAVAQSDAFIDLQMRLFLNRTHKSVFPRVVSSLPPLGRVNKPRASGDHGIEPTPNNCPPRSESYLIEAGTY